MMHWLRVSQCGKYLVASRCDWMYRHNGERDEKRYRDLEYFDGDIVVANLENMGSKDRADFEMMLKQSQ